MPARSPDGRALPADSSSCADGRLCGRMKIDSTSSSASTLEAQREVAVLKKQQDVEKQVGQAVVDLVKSAPSPGRIDTYA